MNPLRRFPTELSPRAEWIVVVIGWVCLTLIVAAGIGCVFYLRSHP